MLIDLLLDLLEELGREGDSDQDDLGICAVLGLREEVGSDKDGVGGVVGDNLESAYSFEWVNRERKLTRTSDGPAGMSIATSASVSF